VLIAAPDCSVVLLDLTPVPSGQDGRADRSFGAVPGQVLLIHADSTAAVLAAAGTGHVALVLLVAAPEADLRGTLAALDALAALAGLPVLVLAPSDGAGFALACYQAGAADVLAASLAPVALARKVERFVLLAQRQWEQAGAQSALHALRDAHGRLDSSAADTRDARQALSASEERYRTLFEAVDEGVCVIEMIYDDTGRPVDYRFLETNSAFERHTGLADAAGKTVRDMVPGHDQAWMDLYGAVARTGEPVRYQNESAGAINRWFDVYATRVGGEGSARVAVLFTDISERKQAQLELQRLAADLTEADRRKNMFLATLAHELRNPLAPLRSALPLLRLAGDDAATRQRVLATMERQLGHLVALLDDLLDVARITHGQIALKDQVVDLAEVVGAAVEAARPALQARRHGLRVDLPQSNGDQNSGPNQAPLRVRGDPTRLIQVLNNLLNNAAKYTPEGGALQLSLGSDSSTSSAILTVTDNGAGIDPACLDQVFELFNQVGRERFPGEGGLGMGLSLVRTLVGLHGGTVSAASGGPGQGSTFTVRLPLLEPVAAPVAPAAPAAPSTQPHQPQSPQHQHPVRVLVVDDNSDAATTLAELLELLGHATQVAHNGQAALEAMQDFRPQLVLLDLGMPHMNGYQVAEAIRNDRRFDQPLLAALTGWGGRQDREQTRAAGFDLHLTKPVDLADIRKALASV
jgi:PAS domain S-box-containing protein